MRHIVSISGGTASAVAAERVINRYGRDSVTLWFADTLWEDDDLYRFLKDLEIRWQKPMYVHREGRTPLQVAEDNHIIPNQKIAPCSRKLKQIPFRDFLKNFAGERVTVHIGMDWKEMHRHDAPRKAYESETVSVDFPLMWKPYEFRPYAQIVKSWGIEPPRLYKLGFPHNNCGGRCVRQGISEWLRLRREFPERFAEVRDWEKAQRAIGDGRSNYAIRAGERSRR